MPPQNVALEAQTRTLIYLGIALATGSKACIEAMMNKAKTQNISKDKILETFKIARYAEATRVLGNAEIVFEHLK
jgi:alkylhydroperoxidase/carboxymuconolactone decarboxylase family protein YurZ